MKTRWLPLTLLSLYCVILFFYGLGAGEFYRNETLRALIARNMLESGNWIVPTLYGEPLFTKPPGMYLAILLASLPFGEVTEWTARLPSALAATTLVFLFYWFFSRQLGRRAGMVAALILPMSLFWLERAASAEIDMLQTTWIAASILFFLRALDQGANLPYVGQVANLPKTIPTSTPSPVFTLHFGWLVASLLCVAAGTLTKWTAPAYFYLTVISLLWWNRNLRLLFGWRHLLAASLAAAVVLGWIAAAVALTSWDVFYTTVSREALQHLAPGQGRHAFPWLDMLTHPLKVFATTLPWSAIALVGLVSSRPSNVGQVANLPSAPGLNPNLLRQALHCWLWPNLLLWSLACEHSIRHCAPLFPAISGLAALVFVSWIDGTRRWPFPRLRPGQVLAASLALWFTCKILFVEIAIPHRLAQRHTRDKAQALAALVPVGKILYLFRLKDEGIMFYFARPVLRLADPTELPFPNEPLFCILTQTEWHNWTGPPAEEIRQLQDAQGDPIILIKIQ